MSGVSSYPRTGGDYVAPEVVQALLDAGYLSESDVQGYAADMAPPEPSGRELIKEVVRVVLKEKKHDASFLDKINEALLAKQASSEGSPSAVTTYHHTGARDLNGFKYERVEYTRREDRAQYRELRAEFDRTERAAWLRDIGQQQRTELLAAGLSGREIDRMVTEGKPPDGYQVHHRIPLDDGGTNSHDNFILIRNDVEHRALHGYYNPAELRIRLLEYGETAALALPVPPKDSLVYPNPAMGYVSISVTYSQFLEVFNEH